MGPARIYPWRKMHRSRAPSIAPGIFFVAQSWADCITNMPGFNFTTGTAGIVIPTQAKRRKRGSPMAQSQGEAKVDEALLSLLPGTKTFVLAHPASAAVDLVGRTGGQRA